MKKWTVVIEVTEGDEARPYSQSEISLFIENRLAANPDPFLAYQIFETIEAPYGPQPNGVHIAENKPIDHAAFRTGSAGRVKTGGAS